MRSTCDLHPPLPSPSAHTQAKRCQTISPQGEFVQNMLTTLSSQKKTLIPLPLTLHG
jgi:hypothetical protein